MISLDRRRFLGLTAAGTFAAVGGYAAWQLGTEFAPAPTPLRAPTPPVAAPPDQRRLVVIEMAGGNDGLSMVVPYTDDRYYALRRNTAIEASRVHRIDDRLGLHPELEQVALGGAAVLAGVGTAAPDLSHFEMLQRWWTGDPAGTLRPTTGFLGRLCDVVGDPAAPAVGVSLGGGPSPALSAERCTTLSMDPDTGGAFPMPDDPALAAAWLAAQHAMNHPDRGAGALLSTARDSARTALRFGDVAAALPAAADGYPDSHLGCQLSLAARVLADDQHGIRIVHVPMADDFDTHTDHLTRYASIMRQFDAAIGAFRADLDRRGLASRVLIATLSEFGRRVPDNDSGGLDHGAASTALLFGPVRPGGHGEQPSLRTLDRDDNLKATVDMSEFYATIAESWFTVPAELVLPGRPKPVPGIIVDR
ncbi:DUF1501 domain-containing protein [Nocardia sp. NPDC004604]|uniref:DUF1501 domain-containing protein n=1 Tax=Nocardia sp. NPDC004604 TaxID=3157013 RepID=UPI0033A6A92F